MFFGRFWEIDCGREHWNSTDKWCPHFYRNNRNFCWWTLGNATFIKETKEVFFLLLWQARLKLLKITDHQKLKYDRNINCRPRTKEHFWGSREHVTEFLEQENLTRVNFRERLNLFLRHKRETPNFVWNKGICNPSGKPSKNLGTYKLFDL